MNDRAVFFLPLPGSSWTGNVLLIPPPTTGDKSFSPPGFYICLRFPFFVGSTTSTQPPFSFLRPPRFFLFRFVPSLLAVGLTLEKMIWQPCPHIVAQDLPSARRRTNLLLSLRNWWILPPRKPPISFSPRLPFRTYLFPSRGTSPCSPDTLTKHFPLPFRITVKLILPRYFPPPKNFRVFSFSTFFFRYSTRFFPPSKCAPLGLIDPSAGEWTGRALPVF